jgi:hypothetical protein
MWGIMTDFQVLQPIQNGQKIKIKNLATDGCLVGKEGFDYYLRAYEIPRQLKKELKGRGYAIIKKLTIEDCQRGYVEFEMPPLIISPEKPPVSSAIFYFVITKEQEVSETRSQEALAISPPLKYTYVPPPPPKITILTMPRITAILEIKSATATEIKFQFKLENFSNANPFYLESITFQLNRQKKWPFKEVQVEVIQPHVSERLGAGWTSGAELSPTMKLTFPTNPDVPLANGTYTVILRGFSYSLDDPNYPWEDGFVSFSLTSVTAKNPQGQVVRSTGQDTSETYKIMVPQPKITIIPQLRTQEIREIRPNTTTQIQYAFEVTNIPTDTPFYLNSLTFRLNQQYQWPFKEIQVEVIQPNTTERLATGTLLTSPRGAQLTVTFPLNPNLPLTNGTYTVMLKGLTYSPQDKDFPYTNGYVSFRFTSVTAKDINNKIEVKSTGEDISHTYKIIVPYYPNVTINAKVGSDEYPALVYEKQGNIATLYFTSFTGEFNAIHAGIQLPATSTLPTRGVTTMGITKTIEVNYDCGGTCPRTYEGLVAKFGSPDQWAIPLIRWDWSKTAQYTLNMYMNCSGWIPQINNGDPAKSKSFIFVCSNRKAFGNNFGWNRQLTVRLNWALTGNEKLSYEVFYPEVVKLSLKNILQKSLPALMFKVKR